MRRDTRECLANGQLWVSTRRRASPTQPGTQPPASLPCFLGWGLRERGRTSVCCASSLAGEACPWLACLCVALHHGSPGTALYEIPLNTGSQDRRAGRWWWWGLDGLVSEPGCQPSREQMRGSTEGWPPENQPHSPSPQPGPRNPPRSHWPRAIQWGGGGPTEKWLAYWRSAN